MTPMNPIAFSPLPWLFTAEGQYSPSDAPPLPEIVEQIASAGFDGLPADVPDGMTPSAFGELLVTAGLRPAPGYFSAPFAEAAALSAAMESAKRVAEQHCELGLTEIFLADDFFTNTARQRRPAQGAKFDRHRLERIAEGIESVAELFVAAEIYPCLHPHIGTWIETAAEAEFVLDAIPGAVLGFGPDSGHLTWSGSDITALVARYRDRTRAVHLKDVHRRVAEIALADDLDYFETTARHLWTEPGRGDADLDGFLRALGPAFRGWLVVEVDIADQATPAASAAVSASWVRHRIGGY
jgi:inosose dehydratase